MPTFNYKGVIVHYEGGPVDMSIVSEFYNLLQKAKLEATHAEEQLEVVHRSKPGKARVRSYHGRDEIFVESKPIPKKGEKRLEEKIAFTPFKYPAWVALVETSPRRFEEIGFVTSFNHESLQPSYQLWEVPRHLMVHWTHREWGRGLAGGGWYGHCQDELLSWYGEGVWPGSMDGKSRWYPLSSNPKIGSIAREFIPYWSNPLSNPDYEKISPVYGWEGTPWPDGTDGWDDWTHWTGPATATPFGTSGTGSYERIHYAVLKTATHESGEQMHYGICLPPDDTRNIWTYRDAGCANSALLHGDWGYDELEGQSEDFTGADTESTPWALFMDVLKVDYTAHNYQGKVHPDNWDAVVAATQLPPTDPASLDRWVTCWPTETSPEELLANANRVPYWSNMGWWYEIDAPCPDCNGLGYPYLYVQLR